MTGLKKTFAALWSAVLALCAAASAGMAGQPEQADPSRPNIVFILADDLGIGDVGAYGGEIISTPHIDALAREGVRLTQGYVSHPVCSPSRAGLMTGRYQQRHGWEFNPAGRDIRTGMAVGERTLADALKAAGYRTGLIGKWHLGYPDPYHPVNRGFDEFFGLLAGGSIYIDPQAEGVETVQIGPRPVPGTRARRFRIVRGTETVTVDGYLTDVFTDEAVSFIERNKDSTFFLLLSHIAPHTPLQATERYLDPYRHIADAKARVYAAMVASLDESVGRVVGALKKAGQYENTLIVFLSDNGCVDYIQGACSNAPYRGFKRYYHEGGVRVPFIMSWPAGLPSGTIYDRPASALDLMATFLSVAQAQGGTEDSVDLLPYLTGNDPDTPHTYLYWRAGPNIAIRDNRWKLIKYNKTTLRPDDLEADGRLTPPDGGWPMDSPHGQLTMLYDMTADPGETTNLAEAHPETVARLKAAHAAWAEDLADEPILPAVRSTLTRIDGTWVQLFF